MSVVSKGDEVSCSMWQEERLYLWETEIKVQDAGSMRLWRLMIENHHVFGERKVSRKQEPKLGCSSLGKTLRL